MRDALGLLFLLVGGSILPALGQAGSTSVYFANGICVPESNSSDAVGVCAVFGEETAVSSRDLLKDTVCPDRNSPPACRDMEFKLAYNHSYGLLLDLLEGATQTIGNEYPAIIWNQIVSKITMALSLGVLDHPLFDFLSDSQKLRLNEKLRSTTVTRLVTLSTATLDVDNHVQAYKNDIAAGRIVVVVAHSQGNLFANQGYDYLNELERSRFGVVPTASPDSREGPSVVGHATFFQDVIIQLVKVLKVKAGALPPLAPNFSANPSGFLNHAFKQYLSDPGTGPFIISGVFDTVRHLQPPQVFFDGFDRADGPVGNGWLNTAGNLNGDLVIRQGVLTTPNPDGSAGVYRPVQMGSSFTASARVTHQNGYGGLVNRYDDYLLFGNDGTKYGGYGIHIYRGDQLYSNSAVNLVQNGVVLATAPASFQFGSSVNVSFTVSRDGSVVGTIDGDGNQFQFSFGSRPVAFPGSSFAVSLGFPDGRSATILNPTVDDIRISTN